MRKWLLATTLLSTLSVPTVAAADPISMAIASTASSVLAAGGVAAATFTAFGLSLTGWGAVFAQFAIRAALGYALNALTPKPGSISRGYTVNSIGSALSHAVIYGEVKVGGAVFYQTTTSSNRYLHRCIAFAGHEIDSYTALYLNDEEVTIDGSGNVTAPAQYSGRVRIKLLTGTATQAADSDLVSEVTEWTTAHQAKGIAYAYVRYDGNGGSAAFPNGLPTLTAKIKGRKVYDPRTTSTSWSDNPVLCLRDYVLASFGLKADSTEVDDDYLSDQADICDQSVGGAKRYTCNGAFTRDTEPQAIVGAILSSMGGLFWYAQGAWGMKPASYVAPSVSFDESDLRGEINIATRNSRRSNFNTVRGIYRGEETSWQETDFTEVTNASYVTEDGGDTNYLDMNLTFTDTDVMAQRIATIALKRNRKQITVSAPFSLKALQVGIGDTVYFSNARAGWASKVFEVNDWRFALDDKQTPIIYLMLREIDSSVFS